MKISENSYVLGGALCALAIAVIADHHGMPQKWHAAIVGTLIAFGGSIWALKRKWGTAKFWPAVIFCLGFHSVLTWYVFQRLLAEVSNIGILVWSPVGFAEGVILLMAIPLVQRCLLTLVFHEQEH
jgi:uncharacterized membrane protein HdeD (DUF308 family)